MPILSHNLDTIGLDIGDRSLKFVQLKKSGAGTKIVGWGTKELAPGIIEQGQIVNKENLIKEIQSLLEQSKSKSLSQNVVACLPEPKTFIKVIEVEKKLSPKDKNFTQDAREQIEKALPLNIPLTLAELRFDWQYIGAGKRDGHSLFLVGAVPKKTADSYMEILKSAKLIPLALEIEGQAIARATIPNVASAAHKKPFLETIGQLKNWRSIFKKNPLENSTGSGPAKIIIDLGAARTSIIVFDNGVIQFTKSLDFSGEHITNLVAEKLKMPKDKAEKAKRICGLDPKKCKGILKTTLQEALGELTGEIKSSISFYQDHYPQGNPVQEIWLTGGGAALISLDDKISEELGANIKTADPLVNLKLKDQRPFDKTSPLAMTTALGLALRTIAAPEL